MGEDRRQRRGFVRVGYGGRVLAFYIALFLLLSSGRMDNYDPFAQLQAATALVRTGSLGVRDPSLLQLPSNWLRARSGDYYEVHDLGGSLFMLPAAALGSAVSPPGSPPEAQIREPPLPSRLAVALGYAVLAGVGCWLLFRLFALWHAPRAAFALSAAFAFCTPLWPYAKSSFDVLGACAGVCGLLWASGAALRDSPRVSARHAAAMGLFFTQAALFRYSLAPFLLLGLLGTVALLALRRRSLGWGAGALALGVAALGFAPTAWYNALRTAEPLRTATTGAYSPAEALKGSIPAGLYGLWLSPNRGLVWYAPVFLLLLALPFVWRRAPADARRLLLCYAPAALAYVLTIAKMTHWAAPSGWGPRYLVPVLPILFLGAAVVLGVWWPATDRRRGRAALVALLGLSAVLNAVPAVVNHRLAGDSDRRALDPTVPYPAQQAAAWRGLLLGLRGEPLPAPPDIAADPVRSLQRNFPDLWAARLVEVAAQRRSPALAAGALIAAALLFAAAVWSLWGLLPRGGGGGAVYPDGAPPGKSTER